MFSAISSYIWGGWDDQVVPDCPVKIDETKTDEEWILVDLSACDNEVEGEKKRRPGDLKATFEPGISESWYVTPPSCFEGSPVEVEANPFEDLLIEHPSMSVYGPRTRSQTRSSSRDNSVGQLRENQAVPRRQNRRTVQFQAHLELIERRRQVEPPKVARHSPNKKHMKRQNKVYFQQSHSRRTKKRDRMVGKHIGLHGKRGG